MKDESVIVRYSHFSSSSDGIMMLVYTQSIKHYVLGEHGSLDLGLSRVLRQYVLGQ